MSTKETLPTMNEEEVAKRLRERANHGFAGAITVEWMKTAANTIDSLRTRLETAEKANAELVKDRERLIKDYISAVQKKLREISKDDCNTWGLVQIVFDVLERQAIDAAIAKGMV